VEKDRQAWLKTQKTTEDEKETKNEKTD